MPHQSDTGHCKSTAAELGTAVTWASAHKSAVTGWSAGFIYICWWSLNIFQMCCPHQMPPTTSCERTAPRLHFRHPSTTAICWVPWLGSPRGLEATVDASLEPWQQQGSRAAQQQGSFACAMPYLCVPRAGSLPISRSLGFKLLLCSGSLLDWGPSLLSQPVYPWTLLPLVGSP